MKLPLYFISDVHFQMTNSKQEKLRRKKMYSFFKKIQNTGGTLIIGGDFFDFWYDYGYYIAPEYSDVFDELDKLNQSGINIHYVAGNHDYWDFGFFKKKFKAKFDKKEYVNTEIINELKIWSKPKLKNEYDTILIGHYHQNGIEKIDNKNLIFMGDWVTQYKVTEFDGQQWHQYTWKK